MERAVHTTHHTATHTYMHTYILSTYTALQTTDHADIATIAQAVTTLGGTAVTLPQTVIAVLTDKQYARLTVLDIDLYNQANLLKLHSY